MDTEKLSTLTNNVESLKLQINQLTKEINKIKIDGQRYLSVNKSITPGVAAKVAYDTNGLVLKGMKLDPSDIPNLQISQITGLKNILDNVADTSDIKKITSKVENMIVKKSDTPVNTATKINYDSNGFVCSGSSLLPDDIPILPIEKIDGLLDLINSIKSNANSEKITKENSYTSITKSGTYTKVSIDSNGRVINGEKLNTNDLPIDFINRIINLESSILNSAPLELVNNLSKSIAKKINCNKETTPGTYTKVSIDSKGLVTNGDKLSINDLPEITIDCIKDLKSELNKRAKYSDIADLNDFMSHTMNSIQSIGDINKLKSIINNKAEADSVSRLEKEFITMKNILSNIQESIPLELITKQFEDINSKINTIEGRISVLEKNIFNS